MRLTVLQELKYDGRRHAPGSILQDVPITTGRRFIWSGLAEIAAEPEQLTPVVNSEPADLMDLKLPDLKAKATEMGIEFPSRANKGELVALIETAIDAEANANQGDSGDGEPAEADQTPAGDEADDAGDQTSGDEDPDAGDSARQE
ncbi:MAG: Rho termination factor N-terminal domain-containing protein [Pigmentiphaga sp.]